MGELVSFKGLVWLALAMAALVPNASTAMAQEWLSSDIVYVCYWSGESWLVASQFTGNADHAVVFGEVVYPDEFGSCPMVPPWAMGMDSTPMAGYCKWTVGLGYPGHGWYLGIAPAWIVANDIATSLVDPPYGTYVWLELDGTCPDSPATSAWIGPWTDELGIVHDAE